MSWPTKFGDRFSVQGEIAKRQSCVVLKALDSQLGDREIAIKVFLDKPLDPEKVSELFKTEVGSYKEASHHALVPIVEAGVQDGYLYYAMEFIEGPTLRDVLKDSDGPMPTARALEIFADLAGALNELHGRNLFHAHLDSRAIILKGGKGPRLVGFTPPTVAKIQKELTSAGKMVVDPAYIAPEQVSGDTPVSARTDVFALGVLLYEMVTGVKPYNAENPLQLAMQRLSTTPTAPAKLNNSIPPLLDAAIVKALSKKPDDRFPSVNEMSDAVCGGKASQKNPFVGMEELASRMGTETMSVQMSPEMLRMILASHGSGEAAAAPAAAKTATVSPGKINGHASEASETSSGDFDPQATAIGMQITQAQPGSLVVVGGPRRDERFPLTKEITLIGSDSACDVRLQGKDVASRYAIVVRRGEGYFVGPLSKQPVSINGATNEEQEETELRRGDVIDVGEFSLRYVAPGEVFTFKENVADRVIDRPKSKVGMILLAVGILVALATVGGLYAYNQEKLRRSDLQSKNARQLSEAREKKIKELLKEGDEYYKNGALIEPVGANAKERFASIIELSPDNSYAKRRLAEIESRLGELDEIRRRRSAMGERLRELETDAEKYFKQGDLIFPPGRNAKENYQEILKIDPENNLAKSRIEEINHIISDLSSKVKVLLARAQVYMDLGQFTKPDKENALDMLQGVLKVDPTNDVAKSALLDMAARSIVEGDRERGRAKVREMREAYLAAQAMGVDPNYLEPRLKGAEIMEKSSATVIIYNRPEGKDQAKGDSSGKYLDTKELERRIADISTLAGKGERGAYDKIFIDMSALK